jgi:DNA-binding GntR family transcriptional regulator
LLLTYVKGFFIDIDNSHKQHKDIINAIINNDPPKAVSAVEEHMNKVKGIQGIQL